jgi:hypothetical protein
MEAWISKIEVEDLPIDRSGVVEVESLLLGSTLGKDSKIDFGRFCAELADTFTTDAKSDFGTPRPFKLYLYRDRFGPLESTRIHRRIDDGRASGRNAAIVRDCFGAGARNFDGSNPDFPIRGVRDDKVVAGAFSSNDFSEVMLTFGE